MLQYNKKAVKENPRTTERRQYIYWNLVREFKSSKKTHIQQSYIKCDYKKKFVVLSKSNIGEQQNVKRKNVCLMDDDDWFLRRVVYTLRTCWIRNTRRETGQCHVESIRFRRKRDENAWPMNNNRQFGCTRHAYNVLVHRSQCVA